MEHYDLSIVFVWTTSVEKENIFCKLSHPMEKEYSGWTQSKSLFFNQLEMVKKGIKHEWAKKNLQFAFATLQLAQMTQLEDLHNYVLILVTST